MNRSEQSKPTETENDNSSAKDEMEKEKEVLNQSILDWEQEVDNNMDDALEQTCNFNDDCNHGNESSPGEELCPIEDDNDKNKDINIQKATPSGPPPFEQVQNTESSHKKHNPQEDDAVKPECDKADTKMAAIPMVHPHGQFGEVAMCPLQQ